jgi:hypothetical protein
LFAGIWPTTPWENIDTFPPLRAPDRSLDCGGDWPNAALPTSIASPHASNFLERRLIKLLEFNTILQVRANHGIESGVSRL